MTFATGSSSTMDAFITSLLAFAVTNAGFTAQATVQSSAGSGSVNIRTVSKGGVYWSMHYSSAQLGTSAPGVFGLRACMAYGNPTAGVNVGVTNLTPSQLNTNSQLRFTVMTNYGFEGAYSSHWLYTDGTCVHGVLLLTTGVYAHISFGVVTKQGTWTGGEYLSACCASSLVGNYYNWDRSVHSSTDRTVSVFSGQYGGSLPYAGETYVRMANTGAGSDFWEANSSIYTSSMTNNSLFMSVSSQMNASTVSESHPMAALLRYAPSTSTWRTPMLPILLMRVTTTPEVGTYVIGRIPRVTFVRMTDDMPNASLIHTDWRVFPLFSRVSTPLSTVAPGSANYAIAYREI